MGPVVRPPGLAFAAFAGLFVGCLGVGCGSSKSAGAGPAGNEPDGSSDEAGEGGGEDDGGDGGDSDAAPIAYPAFVPAVGQIVNHKGGVLAKPKIVTVTWASDTNGATLQSFDDAIVTAPYWATTTAEYGVGLATSDATTHVVVTAAPMSPWADTDIDTWIQQMATSPSSGWPVSDSETLYVVYIPASVEVLDNGADACSAYGGYHTQTTNSQGANPVVYALVPESCYTDYGMPVLENATESASHEIVEAVTDPDAYAGWIGFSTSDLAWSLWNDDQWEVADACESFSDGYYLGTGALPYWLSRTWSNASGKAGHDPCVPAPSGPYNNVTPLGLESLSVTALFYNPDGSTGVAPYTTKGWRIAPGATATVQVGFYSDAPMADWTVNALEGDCCTEGWTDVLTVKPSSFSGKNGDTVSLTITVNAAPAQGTAALLTFNSGHGRDTTHLMPVIIGTY
jgi:hypothetical protein